MIDHLIDEGRVIAGDPDDCVRMLLQASDVLGTNVPGLTFYLGGLPDEHVRRSFRIFKEEVEHRLRGVARPPAPVDTTLSGGLGLH